MKTIIDMMPTIDLGDASAILAQFASDPGKGPVIITLKGKPLVVVLPAQGADVESISVSLNPQFNAIMEQSRRRQDRHAGISSEEMRRRLGLPAFVDAKSKAKILRPKTNGKTAKAKRRVKSNDGQV
jgi:hypothetical protein